MNVSDWKTRFDIWWRHTPTEEMNLSSRRVAGTVADVYTSVGDDKTCVAVKTVSADSSKSTMHDNMMLFSEYQIHMYVYNLYVKENRKLRLIRLHWIKKIKLRGHTVVAFAMDRLYETWYNRTKATFLPLQWKQEALLELKHWNHRWGVFHRDPHLNNIGILPNKEWVFFDMSMACLSNGTTVHNDDAFYAKDEYPSFNMDTAIFNASWCQYQNDASWNMIKRAWRLTHPSIWKPRVPVVLRGCVLGRQGKFIKTLLNKRVAVEMKIKRCFCASQDGVTCTIHGIPVRFKLYGISEQNVVIRISIHQDLVKPDVHHPHIAYYMYDI